MAGGSFIGTQVFAHSEAITSGLKILALSVFEESA
jgi:hypothetical protein